MSVSILATKLYLPPPPVKAVTRAHLIEQLNAGLCQEPGEGRKLTLISAPAGFGKTTLVSAWAAGCGRKVAWLSLDEADSDPARFLTYVVAAIQTAIPDCGEELLRVLQDPQPIATEPILTALLNEIAAIPERFLLALDDYHLIDAQAIDDAITFMIDHLPPQMRLVITTREDPRLPLARLRARGQLTELRAADLRFTAAETAGFLQAMGLTVAAEDIATLEARTEGWIAGLQLAALSLKNHSDAHGFIRAFAGDHRYIVDYLVEEVLLHQPEAVRSFLLQTAVLDRLCGPLCSAVTGQEDGQARLEALERGNFFVIPLDDRRQWYRYHHLFAQVLYAHLLAEQPDLAPVLHRRAGEWFEQQNSMPDAVRHALAGKDFECAARLVELAAPVMRRNRQDAALLGWLQALPDELLRSRPVLSNTYAGTLLSFGKLDGVEAHLQNAERWLERSTGRGAPPTARPPEMVVFSEDEWRHLPALIALHYSGLTLLRGDAAGTIRHARQALTLAAEDDPLSRGGATALLGLAHWANGDLEAAYQTYAAGMANVRKAGYVSDTVASAITLADIRIAQGRLRDALHAYDAGLKLATETGPAVLRGAADMHVGLSELLYERNELENARQHLLRCQELGEHMGLPQNPYRWRVALARLRLAEGDPEGALNLLDEAEAVYFGDFSPNVRPMAAMRARVWVAQGRLDEAQEWARGRGLSAHDDLSYLREFEHITLARILLALHERERAGQSIVDAMRLLERLLNAAEAGGRMGSAIEILILQARARQAQGDLFAALGPLARALALTEPEGYVRIFVDEGPRMAALLEKAIKQEIAPSYAGRLLRAFGKAADSPPVKQGLIEPLSERELEVLRLLGSDLNGPEMARRLTVSLNTLHTHTKNIYAKLGVNNRLAAVRRAEELHLS